jgi:hypothetical protein
MGSSLTGNLPQPRAFDNPLRGAIRRGDPSEQIVPARVAIGVRNMAEFAVIKTHLPRQFGRTRDTRTSYAVDVTGGGRRSPIICKMSANRVCGNATSALWKAT